MHRNSVTVHDESLDQVPTRMSMGLEMKMQSWKVAGQSTQIKPTAGDPLTTLLLKNSIHGKMLLGDEIEMYKVF
jgi:hypothetical protein